MTKRIIVVQEPTLEAYTKKALELSNNGFIFESGRPIGAFLYANFVKDEEEVVEDVEKEPKEPVIEPVDGGEDATKSESNSETIEPVVTPTPVTVEDGDEKVIDLEYAATIEDKDALELYGREFGIELNKRKSLKNMLIELTELSAKA